MGAATGSRLNTTRPLVFITHHLESISFANSTTLSGSNPNFLWSSLSGADAPNVSIPIIRPDEPTYRSHPKVEACSIAMRAVTPAGKTDCLYLRVCFSKTSQDGIDTTR